MTETASETSLVIATFGNRGRDTGRRMVMRAAGSEAALGVEEAMSEAILGIGAE